MMIRPPKPAHRKGELSETKKAPLSVTLEVDALQNASKLIRCITNPLKQQCGLSSGYVLMKTSESISDLKSPQLKTCESLDNVSSLGTSVNTLWQPL